MTGKLLQQLFGHKDKAPAQAYNLWAAAYDQQPGNLMLALDEAVFSALLDDIDIKGKAVVDIGCGTGRHWKKILEKMPDDLAGYDVSEKMLDVLLQKFPAATTYLLQGNKLMETGDGTVDVVISTLTIAHIENVETTLAEWNRVLIPGGRIIITDFHPAALQKAGKRTFTHDGKTVSVKNHIHSIEKLLAIAGQLDWQNLRLVEKVVDDSMKSYYKNENALNVFESFKGVPVIYGLLFKKKDAT